jgi:hypothetical protein
MGIVNNFGIPEITKCFTSERKFEADVIICSPCLLYNAFDTNIDNVELIADKIIILDSLEIQLSKLKIETSIGVFPPLNEKVNYKNCILLCNPSGFDSCTFETHEYYHKFSKRRLHDFKHTNIIRKRFDASGIYNYNRRIRHEEFKQYYSAYNENIGKIIFETIYLDGIVNYSSEKFTEDGLGYYLKLFGIDPAKDHTPLRISKQDIIDKLLCMKMIFY